MLLVLGVIVALAVLGHSDTQSSSIPISSLSDSHTAIPRWCGKPYKPGYSDFEPGGKLHPPKPSVSPLLYIQVKPRHSIYDSSETTAKFIVDAAISHIHGSPYQNSTSVGGRDQAVPFETLRFEIGTEGTDQLLLASTVTINTTGNLYAFDLSLLEPRLAPYNVVLYGAPIHKWGDRSSLYTARTELYCLPAKETGSTVKIDNLYGGMLVANHATNYTFEPFLPFGFYTSCSGYLNYSFANVAAYKDLGYNAINPVCAFTDGDIGYMFDWLDELNIWYQYDMRGSYLNLSSVAEQIPLVKDRSAFLSWYTADEPDGWQYALNSTQLAYKLLKEHDPYHPTGLVLNCDNYHFEEYSIGADYLMEDAYPIGINPTYSKPWNTTCNETYGDCGCDHCVGELQDVSNRLDALSNYQKWLGQWRKPLWAVLQAFSDRGYWSRDPTIEETWAMIMLSFNHRAKAIMSWLFPSTEALNHAYGGFAKVATVPPVSTFLLGAEPSKIEVKGYDSLDVSYWTLENQVMIGVTNLDYADTELIISIELPIKAYRIVTQPWGSLSWQLRPSASGHYTSLSVHGLAGLATSIVILDI